MSKILVLAQGEYIADYARQVQETLPDPEEVIIEVAHMEEAIRLARQYADNDVDVIVARSTTAKMLRDANLPVPIVDIHITNDEILRSILRARSLDGTGGAVGFLGFSEAVANIRPFLDLLGFAIKVYDVTSTPSSLRQIARAKREGVRVMVAGARSIRFVEDHGLIPVLIDTSLDSIALAIRYAREILKAVSFEKKKTRETATILNSVSDAILSLDADGNVAALNRTAAEHFRLDPETPAKKHYSALFGENEQLFIARALADGEETGSEIVDFKGGTYALSVSPVLVDSMPEGAIITLRETLALQRMEASVRKGLYRRGNVANYVFGDIKGDSAALREAVSTARRFAALTSGVLIIGETGTGKELFAQSIHNAGPRADGPFVAVNCGAIPSNLVESELFGHEEGAFTGSRKGGRMGLFELAHNGTIFLDEISEMDQAGQVNLLRALQERQIRRVGGSTPIPVDVRVIAASNANLHDRVRANLFRRDLYYRLSVLVLKLPPLSARPGDVPLIAQHYMRLYSREFGRSVTLTAAALRALSELPWEGNIRQLRNFCERVAAVAPEQRVDAELVRKLFRDSFWDDDDTAGGEERVVLKGKIFERAQLDAVLLRHGGNRGAAAKELGVSRTTLWKAMR